MHTPEEASATRHTGPDRRQADNGRRAEDLNSAQQTTIADALVGFGEPAEKESEETSALLLLVDGCRALTGSCEFSVALRDQEGALHVVAASSEAVRLIDERQLEDAEGPLITALEGGHQVLEVDAQDPDERWPRFGSLVRAIGFQHLYAIPLCAKSEVVGVLDVFDRGGHQIPRGRMDWLRTLATGAANSIIAGRSARQLSELATQLQQALDSRILIEQSKGVIATSLEISIDAAFELLRGHSRNHGRPIREVARDVISGAIPARTLR